MKDSEGRVASTTGELSADGYTLLWDGYENHYDRRLREKYGLKFSHLEAILKEQEYRCYNSKCRADLTDPKSKPRVHHNHATWEIEAVLCDRCNRHYEAWMQMLSADPPARRVGPFHVPKLRQEKMVRRQEQRAERRRRKGEKVHTEQPAAKDGKMGAAERVAAALAESLARIKRGT